MEIGDRAQQIGIGVLDIPVAVDDVEAVQERGLRDAVAHDRADVLVGHGGFQGRVCAQPVLLQTVDHFRNDQGDGLQRAIGLVGNDVGEISGAAPALLHLELVEIDVEGKHPCCHKGYQDGRADEEGGLPADEPGDLSWPTQYRTQERTHN